MRILVVAAHPDDEVLGCGGTIASLSKEHKIKVLILGEGVTSRKGTDKEPELRELRKASQKANAILGTHEVSYHHFPDQRLDTVPFLEIVQTIEEHLVFNPDTVFTHSVHDLNLDHTIVARAVLTATRPIASKNVKSVLSFEIPSSTEWAFGQNGSFQPNVYIDITETIGNKIAAMTEYVGEMRGFPHPRSKQGIRALAMYRGSAIGMGAAEAFELVWCKGEFRIA